jgi:pilus assembly protein CpaB
MKAARLVVLGVALTAGLGASYLMMGSKPQETVRVVAAPPEAKDAVLVAARDLSFGAVIASEDVRWQSWPKDQVPAGVMQQSAHPTAIQDAVGSIVRSNFLSGEPIRSDRLVRGAGSGFMAAVLQPGTRAVAIDLADQGKSAAGGFILPNDRVDVIRTYHPDDAPGATASDTILVNIRVLAIGQSVQEKAAERTVIGGTATLELTPDQAEKVVLAQRTGQLTLSLRSMAATAKDDPQPAEDQKTMTIIRFGNASQSRVR